MHKTVSIFQLNDTHANLFEHGDVRYTQHGLSVQTVGGYARIKTKINEYRERYRDELLVLDNGDTLHGTHEAIESKGAVMIPYLQSLGVNAMTFHWDAAYSLPHLAAFEAKLGYPILAANVYRENTRNRLFKPSAVFAVNGATVGVIGLASNIIRKNMPRVFWEGADFTDGIEEAREQVQYLRGQDVDLIVLLSHLGYPQDIELLKQVDGIDLCLSGHTHNRVRKPPRIGNALIMQSGALASSVGFIRLTIENRRIASFEHTYITLDASVPEDKSIEDRLAHDDILNQYRAHLDTVVGTSTLDLHRGSSFYGSMDYLLLDAMRHATKLPIAFSNGWRYGGAVAKGNLTRRDLYAIVPMNPPLRTAELTGSEIAKLLEDNLESTFATSPFKQMGGYIKRNSGLKVYFKIENPYGQRIQRIFTEEGELDPDRTYTVAYVTVQAVPAAVGRNHKEMNIRAIEAMEALLAVEPYSRSDLESYIPV